MLRAAGLCVVLALLVAGGANAGRSQVPPGIAAAFFHKIHRYDKNLTAIAGDTVRCGFVYLDAASESRARELTDSFVDIAREARDESFQAQALAFDRDTFSRRIAAGGITSLFIVAGERPSRQHLRFIEQLAQERSLLTVTDDPDLIDDFACFAIDLDSEARSSRNHKPVVWVHISRTRACSREFPSTFYRLFQRVDG